ncbi:MAG: hypothetical protein SFY81_00435 [Verrucomicrobiota bacterium]|nr:hypothetical protein [Verrucomicrobiota bacterium]
MSVKLFDWQAFCCNLTIGGMNDRFKTDFLCTSSSFLAGFGSVISLDGDLYHYNTSENPDEIAVSQDWLMVGQDIEDALNKGVSGGITGANERQQAT